MAPLLISISLAETSDSTTATEQVERLLPPVEVKFLVLVCLFVACMSFINVVSAKLWSFAGLTISSGIIAHWFTFAVTDVVGEMFGRKRAPLTVWLR